MSELFFYNFEFKSKGGDILGYSAEWAYNLGGKFDRTTVITFNGENQTSNPQFEIVDLALRKGRAQALIKFYSYFFRNWQRFASGTHFIHMAHYFVILLWPLRLIKKKLFFWYAHKSVSLSLRVATLICHRCFSANTRSFRLKTNKIIYLGHGVPTDLIDFKDEANGAGEKQFNKILIHGRICPSKRIHEAISFFKKFKTYQPDAVLDVIGRPINPRDFRYTDKLKKKLNPESEQIYFKESVEYKTLMKMIKDYDLCINLSLTGSLDKSIVESLAAGVPVITSNEGAEELSHMEGLFFVRNLEDVKGIYDLLINSKIERYKMRQNVVEKFSVESACGKIIKFLTADGSDEAAYVK